MISQRQLPDKVGAGFVLGILVIAVLYGLLFVINRVAVSAGVLNNFFIYPKPHLIILAIMVLCFRVIVVNIRKIELAKGFFMTLFLAFLVNLLNQKMHIF